ncbi:hypothetical protein AB0M45_03080 [Nocardia sp. NPDC051787]|uniref:hypothetical protein n=1 Tax=Nocardia sp. NPDC051787 TaxID=3155415 RepID=UPI00344382E9
MINRTVIVTPPQVCDNADVELAHKQMQRHLACRVDHCLWKAAAHRTLVDAGRLAPQTSSPRERAAARGIAFPPLDSEPSAHSGPTTQTIREVLSKLSELASPAPSTNSLGSEGNQ